MLCMIARVVQRRKEVEVRSRKKGGWAIRYHNLTNIDKVTNRSGPFTL